MYFRSILLLSSVFQFAQAQNRLFATHYEGTVSTLLLTSDGLSLEKQQVTCGTKPSWLTYDHLAKTLYCLDENQFTAGTSTPGSFSTYKVDNGTLTELVKVPLFPDGVHGSLYGGDNGNSYFAIAHYGSSQVTNFKLPLTPDQTPYQDFKYSMSSPGPVPDRQEAPHPHQAKLDPTGSFVLVPDLGADLIRIFAIDKATGSLSSCANYTTQPGRGPRHASFHVPKTPYQRAVISERGQAIASNCITMYVGNELTNTVTAHSVEYAENCIKLTQIQEISTYPSGKAPNGAGLAEVQVQGNSLTVSNRADNTFGANNDSLALFAIGESGNLTFDKLYPTYASFPRTMVINKAGDKVAIGNQHSAAVVVVERDPDTGKMGNVLGSVVVGKEGVEGSEGLSSVVWEE